MDDEPPAWDIGGDEEAPAWDVGGGDDTAAAGGGAVADAPVVPSGPREKCDPPHYTLHWVRPLFLNYRYLYDYRQNYYNDVIDWMNKRNKGIYREEPRAQEWAERAIRMYHLNNKNPSVKRSADMREITQMRHTIRHYSYHTRAYYSLKYMKIL
ncbi:flightin [Leptopilina heterotoma]|uniref:flightin n=1 Tax=Leptopilina heterotoma TaxID=63436 RepID=UPI001CA891C4|nr:flightin [Leptopilina heterotoma]